MDESITQVSFYFLKKHDESNQDLLANFLIKCTNFISTYKWNYQQPLISSIELLDFTKIQFSIETSGCRSDQWAFAEFLFHLTNENHFVCCNLTDEDGEFLLIEAAQYLPKWLEPETSENRAWVHKGQLVIIPNEVQINSNIDAVRYLYEDKKLIILPKVNRMLKARFDSLSKMDLSTPHYCIISMPSQLAYFLVNSPHSNELINLALHNLTMFLSNPLEKVKVMKQIKDFDYITKEKPSSITPNENMIEIGLTLTKFQFAFLKNCDIPRFYFKDSPSDESLDSMKRNQIDMGVKLSFAIELCCQQFDHNRSLGSVDLLNDFPFPTGKEDLIHQKIERIYSRLLCPNRLRLDYVKAVAEISELNSPFNTERIASFLKTQRDIPLNKPDDDNWLYLTPEELDNMMNPKDLDEENIKSVDDDAPTKSDLKETIKQFFNEESSYKGIENKKKRSHKHIAEESNEKNQSKGSETDFSLKDLIKSLDDDFTSKYPESVVLTSKEREYLDSSESSDEDSFIELYSKDNTEKKAEPKKGKSKKRTVNSSKYHPRGAKKPIDLPKRSSARDKLLNDISDEERLFEKLYFETMEEELSMHPASIGRKNISKRSKQTVPLAEEEDNLEQNSSDEDIDIFTESLLKEMPGSFNPGTNLLASMGLPVHQLFAAANTSK